MINLCHVLLLLPLVQCIRCCNSFEKPLEMTVLYESLCPDSQEFINKFWLVYQKYHQCINVTLVPHGKSRQFKNGFKCQHGGEECWGNRMQNCALHSNLNQLHKVKFVVCQMQNLNLVPTRNFKCAKKLNITNRVNNCMSMHGNEYQKEAAKITDQYAFSEVPAIVFNGVFNESIQNTIRNNVEKTLCNILKENKNILSDD